MRSAGAPGLRGDQVAHHVPQRGEVFAVDLLVERLAFRGLLHGFHGKPPSLSFRIIESFRIIDSILTKWVASMSQQKQNEKIWGGSDEAAWLFSQQRVLPGQNRVEPEGFERRAPAAPSSQGRAMRALLSGDQSAGTGPNAGERCRCDPHPVARDHRMAR